MWWKWRGDIWAMPTLLLVSIAYLNVLGPWFFTSRPIQDVGIVIGPAWRIVLGQVPHRDFFQFIGPVTPYLTAAWFALAGHGAAAMIGLTVLIATATALSTYAATRTLGSPRLALVAGVLFLTLGPTFWFTPNYHWTATLFLLLSTLATLQVVSARTIRRMQVWSALAGALAALGVLSHQRAVLGLAAAAACLVLVAPLSTGHRLRALLALSVGAGSVATLILGTLAIQVGVATLAYDLVLFPLTEYPKANQVAYLGFDLVPTGLAWIPSVAVLQGGLAFVATGAGPLALAALVWRSRAWSRRGQADRAVAARIVALFGAASWLSVLYHPGAVHLAYASPWFASAWMVLLAEAAQVQAVSLRRAARLACAGLAAAWLLFLPVVQVSDIARGAIVGVQTPTGWVPLGTASDAERLSGSFIETTEFLAMHTTVGDPVVFFPARSAYNVLLERPNPTWLELVAAGENTDAQVWRVVDELAFRRLAKYVVIETEPAERFVGRGLVPEDQHVGRRALNTLRTELPLVLATEIVEVRAGRP